MARAIFSPTTEPMLPPMNFGSMTQSCTVRPASLPSAAMMASERLVDSCMARRRSL
jgi:hypothetical protein